MSISARRGYLPFLRTIRASFPSTSPPRFRNGCSWATGSRSVTGAAAPTYSRSSVPPPPVLPMPFRAWGSSPGNSVEDHEEACGVEDTPDRGRDLELCPGNRKAVAERVTERHGGLEALLSPRGRVPVVWIGDGVLERERQPREAVGRCRGASDVRLHDVLGVREIDRAVREYVGVGDGGAGSTCKA